DELHLLKHALRELLAALTFDVSEADPLESPAHALAGIRARQPFEPRDESEEVADAHLAIDSALLRKISDTVFGLERGCAAEHREAARVRKQDRHDHSDRRRLAGAVRTDESAHPPRGTTRSRSSTAVMPPKRL